MGKKIVVGWCISEAILGGTLWLFDHTPVPPIAFLSYSVQWLLFIISIAIIRNEPNPKNKFIFANFAAFFAISLLFHLYYFVGTSIFPNHPFAKAYFTQYVSQGAYFFLLALSIGYLTIDALFREFKVVHKYALVFVIVGGSFAYYYQGYLSNPDYAYTTPEINTWKVLDTHWREYKNKHGVEPPLEVLADITTLQSWRNNEPVGILFPSEKLNVVRDYYPYLEGDNYKILLARPLYINTIYMCVLCVGFILIFFGYQYMKDPPQGAYIDKIMFLFLIFTSMEVMHAWSFVKSVEWRMVYELASIGHAISLVILLLIVLFFALRLKFIRSIKGEFYEQEIFATPANVTRWRDALDDLVVAHFFNRKKIVGRLFVGSEDVASQGRK